MKDRPVSIKVRFIASRNQSVRVQRLNIPLLFS